MLPAERVAGGAAPLDCRRCRPSRGRYEMRETFVCVLAAVLAAGAAPLTGLAEFPRHLIRLAMAEEAAGTSQPDTKHEGQSQEGTGFDGEKLFATSCGWCHSSGGRAAGKGPKLAGTDKSDEFIVNRIKH